MNDSTRESESVEVMFDPMKPKHQLLRTPPNKKFEEPNNITDESMTDDINKTQLHYNPHEDTRIVSPIQGMLNEQTLLIDIYTSHIVIIFI